MNKEILEKYCLLAEIITIIMAFSKNRGIAKSIHIRGYIKNTQETAEFEVVEDLVKEAKNESKVTKSVPTTTFRLEVNEEEKKMREITPLPYEKKIERLIKIEDQDYISPDEDGDEDDYY